MICLRKSFRSLPQADEMRVLPAETIPQADLAQTNAKPRQNRLPAEPATGLYPWKAAGCGCPTRSQTTEHTREDGAPDPRRNTPHVTEPVDDPRDHIAHALQANTPTRDTSILIGWVTVAEYITPNGQRYLAAEYGNAPGSGHDTTSWQRRGYLHEALDAGLIDDPIIHLIDDTDDLEEQA